MSKNKQDRFKKWEKILAAILAGLMILSVVATCIYAIIAMIG